MTNLSKKLSMAPPALLPKITLDLKYLSRKNALAYFGLSVGDEAKMLYAVGYRMFCEGYYLHRLLANTFEEERSLAFILSIGWGKFGFCPIHWLG